MAVVVTIPEKIITDEHMCNSLEYITRDTKAFKVAYNLCVKQTPYEITREFKNIRIAFNKDNKILGHQLVQSFSDKDNITPELAHKIGLELMEKCLDKYQVVMATHIDGSYIHNQYIINSVSPYDGRKFLDNNKTRNLIRRVSDELCLKYGLSIVEKDDKSKYAGLDAATLNAAQRGKSWKFNLVKDLDEALEKCKSKEEFTEFFISKDYDIKFTNANITFKKHGEKKAIRADTLAKQFGKKYSSESICKSLNIDFEKNNYKKGDNHNSKNYNTDYFNNLAANEWKRYEKEYQNKIKFKNRRYFDRVLFSRNPLIFTLRLINFIFRQTEFKTAKSKISQNGNSRYKIRKFTDYKTLKQIVGNIPYKYIVNSPGETSQVKLYSWQIAKLLDSNLLLSSKIDLITGTGIVTLKKTDLQRAANILNIPPPSLEGQAHQIRNRYNQYNLSKKGKLNYLVLSSEQVEKLKYYCIDFVEYPKGDKFNIGFAPTDKEKILSILFPNRKENNNNENTFFKRNAKINRELKEQSEKTGEKLCYKIVTSNQYKALRNTTIEFAVFIMKDGNYNVVFLEGSKSKIEKAISQITTDAQKVKTDLPPKNITK